MAINDPGTGTTVGGIVGAVGAAVSAGISSQTLDEAKQAATGLKDAAAAGRLRITPEGFDTLMQALDQCDKHILQLSYDISKVTQAPMLGTSPYAQTVAAHV